MAETTPASKRFQFQTSDGVALAVQEWGNPSGPEIVFIHGISQCHLSWRRQYESALADKFRLITYDLRGHGDSSKPLEEAFYRENQRWADEVHCVLENMQLKRPVLVGWSYAGRIVCDYLLSYGDAAIAGINFVSASTKTLREWASPGGKCLGAMGSEDLTTCIENTRAYLRLCTAQPLPAEEFETMLAYNMITPAKIRAHMVGRPTPYEELLRKVRVPALVSHGEQDQVVFPAVGRYTASVVPNAQTSFYPETGHMPFWEDTARFNRELAEFVSQAAMGMILKVGEAG